tara:strand:- start:1701 stop:1964 length:264 start_codon:yes stop_codon:yes gene_type:complete
MSQLKRYLLAGDMVDGADATMIVDAKSPVQAVALYYIKAAELEWSICPESKLRVWLLPPMSTEARALEWGVDLIHKDKPIDHDEVTS